MRSFKKNFSYWLSVPISFLNCVTVTRLYSSLENCHHGYQFSIIACVAYSYWRHNYRWILAGKDGITFSAHFTNNLVNKKNQRSIPFQQKNLRKKMTTIAYFAKRLSAHFGKWNFCVLSHTPKYLEDSTSCELIWKVLPYASVYKTEFESKNIIRKPEVILYTEYKIWALRSRDLKNHQWQRRTA